MDRLEFYNSIFLGLSFDELGRLDPDAFVSGAGLTAAQDAEDRFVYDTTTGALYYDADGLGGADAVAVAVLGSSTHPTLTSADIYVTVI